MPAARRRGLGSRLLDELETHARDHQVTTLRLDTRRDLVEARQLYARHGYTEVRPFSHGPYSDHWFQKDLFARASRTRSWSGEAPRNDPPAARGLGMNVALYTKECVQRHIHTFRVGGAGA